MKDAMLLEINRYLVMASVSTRYALKPIEHGLYLKLHRLGRPQKIASKSTALVE